ncbi:MAG: ribonuclease HII [Minisyncoccia bacterium]
MNFNFEKFLFKKGFQIIIGLDEAGRGPLAGPVYAGAVLIRKKDLKKLKKYKKVIEAVRDSKRLKENIRKEIFDFFNQAKVLSFSFSFVSEKIIDKINIERATKKAMKNCLKKFNLPLKCFKKTVILIDGNKILDENIPIKQIPIIKGDDKIFTIALASIIAKVKRDDKMKKLSKKYPFYKFEIHKGYPTKLHLELLKKYGPCQIHRKTFNPIRFIDL